MTPETGTGDAVVVIDQTGHRYFFDADDWHSNEAGPVEITKDGKRVATFPPGYIGVYKASAVRIRSGTDGASAP